MSNDELQIDSIWSKYTDKQPHSGSYRLNIIHLYPDLLNLYGDRGNIQCMRMRCKWRGIDANENAAWMIISHWLLQILSFWAEDRTGSSRLFVPAFRRSAGICAIMWKTAALCLRSAAAISCWATTTTPLKAVSKVSHCWISTQSRARPD